MKNTIALALLTILLAACGSTGQTKVERVDLNVTSRKLQFVELDMSVLDACKVPRPMRERLSGYKDGKVREADVVAALVESYTNEANCFLAKQELMRLQRDVKSKLQEAENGKQQ